MVRVRQFRMLVVAIVPGVCALFGCGGSDRAVDPDGHDHETRAQTAPLPDLAIDAVVGAVAGVPQRDASRTLDRWLSASPEGQRVLARWARNPDGTLDAEHPPVRLATIDASIGPGSKSKCGDVTVLYSGDAGVSLRMRLTIPGTVRECRGLFRASRVTNGEAVPLLRAAIADAHVPDNVQLDAPPVAQN